MSRAILAFIAMMILGLNLDTASAATLEVGAEKETYYLRESVKVVGKIQGVVQGYDVAIRSFTPSGKVWSIAQASPDKNGGFSTPLGTIASTDETGTYRIEASYGNLTATAFFSVIFPRYKIELSLNLDKDVVLFGESVGIQVVMNPTSPLGNMTILYAFEDGQWISLSSAPTAKGLPKLTWKPDYPGVYAFKAIYAGDSNYEPATSSERKLTVRPVTIKILLNVQDRNFTISLLSNSLVTGFRFNQEMKKINFTARGAQGGSGFAEISIPSELLGGKFTVTAKGAVIKSTVVPGASENIVIVNYPQNSGIEIIATQVIPEFPVVPLFVVLMLILLLLHRIPRIMVNHLLNKPS